MNKNKKLQPKTSKQKAPVEILPKLKKLNEEELEIVVGQFNLLGGFLYAPYVLADNNF